MDRAERRRHLKEDERLIARGLDFTHTDGWQVVALMRVLRDRLGKARNSGTIAPLMTFLHENFGRSSRRMPGELAACAKGCSHCCHMWVSLRAPEALFIKAAIPARERADLHAAIHAAHDETGPLSYDDRVKLVRPCPLLQDDACRIYAARPLVCRTTASEDAAVCRRAYRLLSDEEIPQPLVFINQRTGYSIALAGALKHAGYPAGAYEFNDALHTALARPDAEAAWLKGEDIFAAVQRDPGGDPFANPTHLELYREAFS
ncbi:MAG: YkgJ family cysteine cluster protein [Sphingomonas sp.]